MKFTITKHEFDQVANHMETLAQQLSLPPGHRFSFDRRYAEHWIMGHQGRFGCNMSAYIRREPSDMYAPDQIDVEVRVFLREAPERKESMLFVTHGPQYNFLSKSLLSSDKEPFVYADDWDALFSEVVARVNRALARAPNLAESLISSPAETDIEPDEGQTIGSAP